MALTDKSMYREQDRKDRKKPGDSNKHWSDEQKIELVKMYLLTGNLTASAAVLKIPRITAQLWKAKDWWKQLESELRVSGDLKVSARFSRVIEKSLDVLEDRLENGDFIYDSKVGKMIRKPVAMKDAHRVAMDMVDKNQMIEKKLVQAPALEESQKDKFVLLAEQFAALAKKVIDKPPVEVTDVVFVENKKEIENSIHEETSER